MKTIKAKSWDDVPNNFTGIVEWDNGLVKDWYKNGDLHKEEGPARIYKDDYKVWWLDGKIIWSSYDKLDLTNKIILSKTQHLNYPIVQIWKVLDSEGIYELTVIPGMEEVIKE